MMVKKGSNKEMTFKERVKKFEKYYNDPDHHHKIFSELGFSYIDDGCDGFCPKCEQKDRCETYAEIGWKNFKDNNSN